MSNINDFIQEIHTHEALTLEGTLDPAKQWRIEERIFQTISEESSIVNGTLTRQRKRKLHLFLAAAVMVLALGITAFATVHNEWDIALVQFMGIQDSSTLQLESGEVQMNIPANYQVNDSTATPILTSPIQMTVVSSIGDKNSAYIHIKTNYELPKDYSEEADYIVADFILNEESSSGMKDGMFVDSFIDTTVLNLIEAQNFCASIFFLHSLYFCCSIYIYLT